MELQDKLLLMTLKAMKSTNWVVLIQSTDKRTELIAAQKLENLRVEPTTLILENGVQQCQWQQ